MKSTPLCFLIITAVCAFALSAQAGGHQGSQGTALFRSQAVPALKSDHLMTSMASKPTESVLFAPPRGGANQSAAVAQTPSHFTVAPWLTGIFDVFRQRPPAPQDFNPHIMGSTSSGR